VKDGDFIMHLQNNSLEWLITYYGILKTGAVVVPLNFRFVGPDILYAADVCIPRSSCWGLSLCLWCNRSRRTSRR